MTRGPVPIDFLLHIVKSDALEVSDEETRFKFF